MSAPAAIKVATHGNNPFLRLVGWISTICGLISAFLILGAIGVTCQMLYVRYVLGASTDWQTEAVTFMMVVATLIGLPYVQRLRGHVNVDLIPLMLPRGVRKSLCILVLFLSIAVTAIIVWYGIFDLWLPAFEKGWRTETMWAPKQWPFYLAVPVGFGLLMLQLIADLVGVVTGIEEPFSLDPDDVTHSGGA